MLKIKNQKFVLNDFWRLKKSIFLALFSVPRLINFGMVQLSKILKLNNILGYPYSVFVEPSSFCNFSCPMCPKIQKGFEFDNRNMTLEEFKIIMDDIGRTTITLRLWNYGEPYLNKDLFDMVRYAKKYNIFTIVSTNGIFFNEKNIVETIKCGLDYLIISLDGASRETFKKTRLSDSFEEIIKSLRRLMELRNKEGHKLPYVTIQFIIMKENAHEISKIKDIAEDIKVDKLSIRYLDVVSEKGKEYFPNDEKLRLSQGEGEFVNFCSYMWDEVIINSTGMVSACCMDAGPEYTFGNYFDAKSMKEIWNGKKYVAFRKQIKKDISKIKICKPNCYRQNNRNTFFEN